MLTQRHWLNLSLALLLISLMSVLVKGYTRLEIPDNSEYDFPKPDKTTTMGKFELKYKDWKFRHSMPFIYPPGVGIEEYFADSFVQTKKFLSNLSAIDRSQLDRNQQYVYDTMKHILVTKLENYQWRNYGPLNPKTYMDGFYNRHKMWVDEVFIMLMDPFGWMTAVMGVASETRIPQAMMLMDKAIEMGTTYHLASVQDFPDQIHDVTSVPPEESVIYEPFKTNRDSRMDFLNYTQTQRDTKRSQGLSAITRYWKAWDNFTEYLIEKYIPNTRATYGVYGLPSGRDLYRACVKWYVTYDVTPEEVHYMGLKEVDRIAWLMHQVMRNQNFKGTIRQYFNRLENDPRFVLYTPEQVIQGYTDIIKNRIYPKLSTLFGYLPADRITVNSSASDGPYIDYIRFHGLRINTDRPSDTKTFNMLAWALQAAYPGDYLRDQYEMHHYEGFVTFYPHVYRNVPFEMPLFTNFYGGWSLYALYLGEEMGLYLDDNELMGRYSAEMMHACHLVLDTGLHYFGWSREEAINYLHDRVSMSMRWVERTVDWYIIYPGQAIAYKMGEQQIRELREMAENALGPEMFDVREFHSRLLKKGRVPFHVQKNIIQDYIADTLAESNVYSSDSDSASDEQ